VRGEAAITGYNDLHEVKSLPRGFAESTLGLVEGEAAPIVSELVQGRSIDAAQRGAMATFLYVQYHRTPRGRQWFTYGFEQTYKLSMMQRLLDPKEVQELHRRHGEKVSLDEAERRGREWFDQLDSGELELKAGHDHAVGTMFMFASDVAPRIAGEMTWEVLHAPPDGDFITSDHPILIHDATAPPGYGAGWLSSPDTKATFPIDTKAALRLFPGPRQLNHVNGTPAELTETNLRTYASAEWAIYGRSAGIVQKVRARAKQNKLRVARFTPSPPTIHILEEQEGDPGQGNVQRLRPKGEVKRRQRWPRWNDEND
jgi:Protein of unknown function (DUF4238)